MSIVRIPFLSKSEQGRPLQRALDRAAERTKISTYSVALVLSHVLEQVAEEVSKGHVVRLPGFGTLAPVLDERPQYVKRRGGPVCVPRFSAARGFRAQTMLHAPRDRSGKRAIDAHASNHRVSATRYTSSRVFTSQRAFREQLSAQLARCL